MNSSILSLDNIVKTYDKNVAVDGVSFEVPKGSIFGLLGPNGAGKTSLIRIITTITRADTGTVLLDGEKLNSRHPEQIGYMPEERGLYRKMKVGEHLLYLARLKGLSKEQAKLQIKHWLEKFEIEDWWDKKVEELSKGMQQKIQFIATVVHEPKLLILDEPFSGLDPVNTNLIKDEIHELHNKGVSIIFSTHRMEQVEEVCEHIVLINKGRNVLEGKVQDIKNQFKRNRFQIDYEGTLPPGLELNADIVEQSDHSITIQVDEEGRSNELLQYLLQNGVFVHAFNEILPSLNEIFIRQVKRV
ncbi:MAG: ATP-binding cassette domain-containing protein [Lewinellaceae bacterium]|nr:ATP-binding cassette domain-containing protein [Phaeodactylibacter sp.]MCB0611947.1 ATP-binding cassette domain-containing protein [Phaeodactylibacter sp.]MCB9346464.1 ATP-binding cassette domain-containing protein [Lewinellaceae bacterium]